MRGAEPYIAAALAGLCAQPKAHDPEQVAALAVKIGVATAREAAALERAEDETRAPHVGATGPGVRKAKGDR